ncbi:bifunctional riboflavin kinase/FAD synthetase [Leucobacter sp. OH1287]|uniref:bifunctional riboflavin kinase/FAD synthetase n=1 Tax=Leucobacter sp. OH1287 TaxID=2491049 RepID=UPI000F5EC500|nr:bifunctional riboflavin kinase/FAD synthetase [Leucobacter sp. OH1287]RRD60048.1 bifunctional riboflavin kinase/FAD synthetase [Leucobacter sp. OH1287]
MRSFRSFSALPADAFQRPTVTSIGKFDGLHLGHQQIIQRLQQIAAEKNLESCVFTFTENPLAALRPADCPPAISSPEQRLELLAAAGVSATLIVDFTRELQQLTPRQFAEQVLVAGLNTKHVLVGADFRFGKGGAGDTTLLTELGEELGFVVEIVGDVEVGGGRVSSSRIRQLIIAGDVAQAKQLLGRPVTVRGMVVHGAARGRELGFPTANLEPKYEGLAPADGVYAGLARVLGETYRAAISVGGNPTFTPDAPSQIEVFLLDFHGNLYGESVEVEFLERLRGMTAFDNIDALLAQMHSDVAQVREIVTLAN